MVFVFVCAKGLKDMDDDDERIEALTERLQDAGATWKGKYPTKHDISKAKAEKRKKDDLDGIDTSLIIDDDAGGRGGRRAGRRSWGAAVNYAEKYDQGTRRWLCSDSFVTCLALPNPASVASLLPNSVWAAILPGAPGQICVASFALA